MKGVALYTFGLLDPAAGPGKMSDFARRAEKIFDASDRAPGFLGRAEKVEGPSTLAAGGDHGKWGLYVLPLNLPDFAGQNPAIHIATLSVWREIESARQFVYKGLHSDALRIRHDWFLKGPWPGHVLWRVEDGDAPTWSDGVRKLEALARDGEAADRFTFRTRAHLHRS